MDADFRVELMKVVALLEERHGLGLGSDELPRWLEERLLSALGALLSARGLEPSALLPTLRDEPELVVELANALRVGETRFYRDAAQWEALRRSVIAGLWARRSDAEPLLALSAGCSTGEEAWTLAMLLSESFPRGAATRVRVLGVDRSAPALITARAGIYDSRSPEQLPRELAQRFLRPSVDGSVRIVPELEPLVTFLSHDLRGGPPPGRYALIVCKNVLSSFADEAQEHLVQALQSSLSADGILLVARSEVPTLLALGAPSHEIAPGITAFRSH